MVPISPALLCDLVPPFGGRGGILGCLSTRTRGCSRSPWGLSRAWRLAASSLGSLKGSPLPGQLESLWLEWTPERPPLASHSRCARQPDFCALPLMPTPTLPCPSPLPQLHRADPAGREQHTPVLPQVWRPDVQTAGVPGPCPYGRWGGGVLCLLPRPGTKSLPCLPGSSRGPLASSSRARRSLYLGHQGEPILTRSHPQSLHF